MLVKGCLYADFPVCPYGIVYSTRHSILFYTAQSITACGQRYNNPAAFGKRIGNRNHILRLNISGLLNPHQPAVKRYLLSGDVWDSIHKAFGLIAVHKYLLLKSKRIRLHASDGVSTLRIEVDTILPSCSSFQIFHHLYHVRLWLLHDTHGEQYF